MDKRLIPLKLSYNQLEALHGAYIAVVEDFDTENDHERLLREHAVVMRDMLGKLEARQQSKYTLNLTSTDAMAYHQLWQLMQAQGFKPTPYQAHAVRKVFDAIDVKHVSAKQIARPTDPW